MINVRNIKTEKINCPFKINNNTESVFIYNNKDNIYIYSDNNLYNIKYIKKKLHLIESFDFNKLEAINYISNKYINLNNIIINCIENLDSKFFLKNINLSKIEYDKIKLLKYFFCNNLPYIFKQEKIEKNERIIYKSFF